jgi:hypothetical protein
MLFNTELFITFGLIKKSIIFAAYCKDNIKLMDSFLTIHH